MIFSLIPTEVFYLFGVPLWCLWNDGNIVLHGGLSWDPLSIVEHARQYLIDFNIAKASQDVSLSITFQQRQQKWQKPPTGSLKMNIDTMVKSLVRLVGLGRVI